MYGLINPREVIEKLPMWEGMTIADFGSGSGWFTIELAKALKNTGQILAIDIQPKALKYLEDNFKKQNLLHLLKTKICDLETKALESNLSNSFDEVTVINTLFQIKNKEKVIKEAKKILKPNGFLVIVDWEKDKLILTKNLFPTNKEEIIKSVVDSGFLFKDSINLTPTHYCLIFIKKP